MLWDFLNIAASGMLFELLCKPKSKGYAWIYYRSKSFFSGHWLWNKGVSYVGAFQSRTYTENNCWDCLQEVPGADLELKI